MKYSKYISENYNKHQIAQYLGEYPQEILNIIYLEASIMTLEKVKDKSTFSTSTFHIDGEITRLNRLLDSITRNLPPAILLDWMNQKRKSKSA